MAALFATILRHFLRNAQQAATVLGYRVHHESLLGLISVARVRLDADGSVYSWIGVANKWYYAGWVDGH